MNRLGCFVDKYCARNARLKSTERIRRVRLNMTCAGENTAFSIDEICRRAANPQRMTAQNISPGRTPRLSFAHRTRASEISKSVVGNTTVARKCAVRRMPSCASTSNVFVSKDERERQPSGPPPRRFDASAVHRFVTNATRRPPFVYRLVR